MPSKPGWRLPRKIGTARPGLNPAFVAARGSWTAFDQPGRVQCSATARGTGKRCRCPAIAGRTTCRMHGGMSGLAERIPSKRARRVDALVKLGMSEPPPGFPVETLTGLFARQRGECIEAWLNRGWTLDSLHDQSENVYRGETPETP